MDYDGGYCPIRVDIVLYRTVFDRVDVQVGERYR